MRACHDCGVLIAFVTLNSGKRFPVESEDAEPYVVTTDGAALGRAVRAGEIDAANVVEHALVLAGEVIRAWSPKYASWPKEIPMGTIKAVERHACAGGRG